MIRGIKGRLVMAVFCTLFAALVWATGCQSHEKRTAYEPREGDVNVRAPGTAVDVGDDAVHVDAPFVNVRVRH